MIELWPLLAALGAVPAPAAPEVLEATFGHVDSGPIPVVVMLHGRGASPEALLSRLRHSGFGPACRVLLLRGPHEVAHGHAWFSRRLTELTADERDDEAHAQAETVVALLEELRADARTAGRPWLAGYSQGGVVALATRDLRPDLVAGVVAAATWVPPSHVGGVGAPPIHLIHGSRDGRLPVREVRTTARQLRAAGHEVALDVVPGGRHGLGRELWRAWVGHLARAIRRSSAPR